MGELDSKTDEMERAASSNSSPSNNTMPTAAVAVEEKKTFWQRAKTPGSVWQIILAAILAIVIGLAVTTTVDEVPEAAIVLLAVPGNLWLRALRAVGMCHVSYLG